MKLYMNYLRRAFVLTHEALEVMGRPRYITFMISKKHNQVIMIPLRSRRSGIGVCSIPESVYQYGGAYAIETTYDFLEQMYFLSDVSGESVYALDAEAVYIDKLDANEMRGLEHSIMVKGIALAIDMMSAEPAEMNARPVYTFRGYRLA